MVSAVCLLSWTCASWSQDQTQGEQLQLELGQLRSEVDFLRSQLETGGGVADVRFDDLQTRIDKVLDDAASLATEANTARRQAEIAVNRVADLEEQLTVMQASVDQLATRLARMEADAVFNVDNETVPTPAEVPDPDTFAATASDDSTSVVTVAANDGEVAVQDESAIPLPKDRADTLPPSREVTVEVAISDDAADVIALPGLTEAPGLIAMEGALPVIGGLPILPLRRPESPVRLSSEAVPAGADGATGEGTDDSLPGTFDALRSDETPTSARSSSTAGSFDQSRDDFELGNFEEATLTLQALVDADNLGARAPEGYFMLGVSYLRTQKFPSAIQTLALGLRQYPNSEFAGPSLVNLADALNANGQTAESCRLLSFVPIEYPRDTQAVADAERRTAEFGC